MRRMLCPIDFSEHSRRAVHYGCAIARSYNATVTGLYVIGPIPILLPQAGEGLYPPVAFTREDFEQFKTQLETFMRDCGTNHPVEAVVLEGSVTKEIVRLAEELPADLIVMGTHGRTGFDRLLLGSVTEKLLRKAPCPLLTVPAHAPDVAQAPPLFRQILCAVDLSPSSLRALSLAESLARKTGAHLRVMHVVEPRSLFDPVPMGPSGVAASTEEMRASAHRRFEAALASSTATGIAVSEVSISSKPYREILRESMEQVSDLIVIGAHGAGTGVLAFGSTAHHIVREAACPVLTVRA